MVGLLFVEHQVGSFRLERRMWDDVDYLLNLLIVECKKDRGKV